MAGNMTLKINVGCWSLASEMNDGNIRAPNDAKINVGVFIFSVGNEWR